MRKLKEMSNEEMDNLDLIINLISYSKKLERMIIQLRSEVNALTPEGENLPYFELHSDIYENFFDYPTIIRYQKYIELYFDMEDL
ncbi:hypothetical protein [Gracilibacillus phocaeensis]|uniref:hypothetical protein n=1 Tax=Gracilibacillus phocaeensis TaxID=2042304 RepID=UPI0010304B5D|nr:hypothetical protein [Gracilibacillus phocaeensis]